MHIKKIINTFAADDEISRHTRFCVCGGFIFVDHSQIADDEISRHGGRDAQGGILFCVSSKFEKPLYGHYLPIYSLLHYAIPSII